MSAAPHSETSLAANSNQQLSRDMQAKLNIKATCLQCQTPFQRFKLRHTKYGRKSLKEFTLCIDCWKASNSRKSTKPRDSNVDTAGALFDVIASVNSNRQTKPIKTQKPSSKLVLDHYIFDGSYGWMVAESASQPRVKLQLSTKKEDYEHLQAECPKISPRQVIAITDTGAQSSLMGLNIFKSCGFTTDVLLPVTRKMYAANNEGINILGAILCRLSGTDKFGHKIETGEMIYVSDSTNLFYLSRHAMAQLQIIDSHFPQIGAHSSISGVCINNHETNLCDCPARTNPPSRPQKLPFQPIESNIPKMKEWLLARFASSTFNKCTHQRLPMMSGPPIEIHVDPLAKPTAVHTPASVPIHWSDAVKAQLETDVRLGVIEKLKPNTPITWCHRAIWTRKADGTPRRVVDFQSLNKHCIRDTHHTVPPFKQARSIPHDTFRTVTDAWNGYHSLPVREQDRHLLTFITEMGRFRYCVAPQGYLSSGDE